MIFLNLLGLHFTNYIKWGEKFLFISATLKIGLSIMKIRDKIMRRENLRVRSGRQGGGGEGRRDTVKQKIGEEAGGGREVERGDRRREKRRRGKRGRRVKEKRREEEERGKGRGKEGGVIGRRG